MTETPFVRQRVNVAQTAKGLHQVEATVEVLSEQGEQPKTIAENIIKLIHETELQLIADGRKLVINTE